MKRRIDEGVCIETEPIILIQWFTQPDGERFVPWVRIERDKGLSEIHVRAGEAVATLQEAERVAKARAERIIAETVQTDA